MPMDFPRPLSFRQLLDEAIRDLTEHGYVSQQQVEDWLHVLRSAAERELGPEGNIDDTVRAALGTIYDRLVERGRVVERVPGVDRYTLARIKPTLRAELDRRILASADLIKLRRREAIEKTLQRFSGWSTSIPPGGAGVIDKRQVRQHITKGLAQYKFEQRRVAIDQGHKLIANVANLVAVDNGAIAAEWHSHWRQAGYRFRPDHKERDGHVYAIRDNWAIKAGLMTKGAGYLDEITQPGQEPFCRCWVRYISSPRRLPESMLTKKGRQWIAAGGSPQTRAA